MNLLRPTVFVLGVLPLCYCLYQIGAISLGFNHSLGADPGKAIVKFNGEWALRFLLLTLCLTPLREYGIRNLMPVRRMLGLFGFTYAFLHLLGYLAFLLEFRFSDLAKDIVERPYITFGFAAFICLVPLAITSNTWMIRRLRHHWKPLHRLVYLILILALVHFFWLTRSDYTEVAIYSLLAVLLLVIRAKNWLSKKRN